MHARQYQRIAEHPLRLALRGVVVDPRDLPAKSQLRATIDEALEGVDVKVRDAVFTKALEFAKAAADDPGARFDLRGACDRLTLHVLEELEAGERIVPAPADTTAQDVSAALDSMDNFDPTEKAQRALQAELKAGEIEAARRLAGGTS